MYLTKLDKNTGLVLIENENDGVLSISEFREIINHPELGIKCFTSIALTVDYLSTLRFYDDKDRPKKAMEEVTGNRNAFVWKQEIIQLALKKYADLQYDPTIEEGQIHYQRKINKLNQYRESEEKYGKGLKDENGELLKITNPATIAKELKEINSDISDYEKQIQGKDIYDKSPVKNGYSLSRLEQKLEKKTSFYKEKR